MQHQRKGGSPSAVGASSARLIVNGDRPGDHVAQAGRGDAIRDLGGYPLGSRRGGVEDGRVAFVAIDQSGHIVAWNAQAERIFGWPASEVLGHELAETIIPPAHRAAHRTGLARYLDSHQSHITGRRMELRGLHRDGHEIPIEIAISDVGDSGTAGAYFVAFILDRAASWRTEEELRELAQVVESAFDAIITEDLTGEIRSWNRGAELLYGYSAQEMIGRPIGLLEVDICAPLLPGLFQRVSNGETVSDVVTQRRRKDGRIVDVSLSLSPLRDATGAITGVAGISRDITDRRRAEEAVARSEASLREAQAIAHVGSWQEDLLTGAVTISEELRRINGLPLEGDLSVFDLFERVHPDDALLWVALRDPYGAPCSFSLEHRVVRTDGEQRFVHTRAEVEYGPDGNPVRLIGTVQDITELRVFQETLRVAEERFQRTFHYAPIGMALTSPDGKWLRVNKRLCEITGYPEEELVGTNFVELTPDRAERDRDFEAVRRMMAGELDNYHAEKRYRRMDGSDAWVEVSVSPVRDTSGQLLYFISQVQDVSDRHEQARELAAARDAALQASQLKSEFLATMSHEIRTPLNGVIGMAGMLLDTELSPQQREYADTVRRCGATLLEVINDILDFTKIEAGRLELESVDFDVRSVVHEVADLLAARAHEKQLELIVAVEPRVPVALRGDPGRVRQVLINLVANAVKFTDSGEVVIDVTVDAPTVDTAALRCTVRDTGIGIDASHLEHLFEPFRQADASTTRRYGGTGLGLAICRRLITLMGGDITVRSDPGSGSEFSFVVPVGVAADAPQPARVEDLDGLQVLVADDNATNRRVLERQLSDAGLRVAFAPDGRAALDALVAAAESGSPFPLAVIDGEMPAMDGYELVRAIAADHRLDSTGLVMLSSWFAGTPPEGFRQRVAASLTKPARGDQLVTALAGAHGIIKTPQIEVARARGTFSGRVLVAEDNPVNQRVARLMLESMGLLVDVVGNGFEAVEALDRSPYDLVLMDCEMPELDGYAASRTIRAKEVEQHVPIIAVTAAALSGDEAACREAGMDDYIAKPVRPDELAGVIARYLPRRVATATADGSEPFPSEVIRLDRPVLDEAMLMPLRRIASARGPEVLEDLVKMFSRTAEDYIDGLRSAAAAKDSEQIHWHAHKLRGSAGGFGAARLADLCELLESAAPERWPDLVERADQELALVRKALHEELAQASTG